MCSPIWETLNLLNRNFLTKLCTVYLSIHLLDITNVLSSGCTFVENCTVEIPTPIFDSIIT